MRHTFIALATAAVAVLGLATPASAADVVYGIDVTGAQGNVDWSAVYDGGARFAGIKATEGMATANPYFAQQYNGSARAGLTRGAYHVARPDSSSGAAQADFFVDHGGAWSADGQTLPGTVDLDWNPYGASCYGLSATNLVAWIRAFADEYHARTSRWPMIYTVTTWWATCTGNRGDFSATSPLWIGHEGSTPGPLPYAWTAYTFWQYAGSGALPGGQDQFNGSLAQLQALAG